MLQKLIFFKLLNFMGCTASTHHKPITLSRLNRYHAEIEQQLLPMLQITHPSNINQKYKHILKIIPDKFVNRGPLKTPAYVCLVSSDELRKSREEFWGNLIRNQDGR